MLCGASGMMGSRFTVRTFQRVLDQKIHSGFRKMLHEISERPDPAAVIALLSG